MAVTAISCRPSSRKSSAEGLPRLSMSPSIAAGRPSTRSLPLDGPDARRHLGLLLDEDGDLTRRGAMPLPRPALGLVDHFAFLWRHERDAGREGRGEGSALCSCSAAPWSWLRIRSCGGTADPSASTGSGRGDRSAAGCQAAPRTSMRNSPGSSATGSTNSPGRIRSAASSGKSGALSSRISATGTISPGRCTHRGADAADMGHLIYNGNLIRAGPSPPVLLPRQQRPPRSTPPPHRPPAHLR